METLTHSPVKFNAEAVEEIHRLMQDPNFNPSQLLRVGVKGGGCSGLTYVLGFDVKNPGDQLYQYEGVPFIIDKAHEIYLYGMEIEWNDGLNNRGFSFKNPNAFTYFRCGTSFSV